MSVKRNMGLLFLITSMFVFTTGCVHEEVTYELNKDGTGSLSALVTLSEIYSQSDAGEADNIFGISNSELSELEGFTVKETPIEELINGEKFIGTKVEMEIPDMTAYILKAGSDTLKIIDLANGNKRLEFIGSTKTGTEGAIEQTPEQLAQTYSAMKAVNAKIALNIKTDYQVVGNNATSVANGTYSWDLLEMIINEGKTTSSACYIEYVPVEANARPSLMPLKVTAVVTSSKVMVNGAEVVFDAYNINGSNYFKLRDVATAVNGKQKQFNVEWDVDKKAINLISNSPYKEIGGELTKGDGFSKFGKINASPIFKDGVPIELNAYNINGNNYFKLRDLGTIFNMGVDWDGPSKLIKIDTTLSYKEE